MLFSVLIANYNNAVFLDMAIGSVLQQTHKEWEIILVDDGSTDGFESVIVKYIDEQRLRVFRNDRNRGCGYTKAKCIELASGQIMGFLDPDDALHPHALQQMIFAHRSHPSHSLIHSTHYVCNNRLEIDRIAEYVKELPANVPYLFLGDGSVHLFAAFTKKAYMQTAGISSELKKAVDKDLYYKLEEVGPILFVNKPLYYYRIHEGSISNMGHEAEAMLIHYGVARLACQRRIAALRKSSDEQKKIKIRDYRVRYHKLAIFENFRKKKWLIFFWHSLIFCFVGGRSNLISYARKIPSGGFVMINKSLSGTYRIHPTNSMEK